MLFNSLQYLFFLPIVVTIYYSCPARMRRALLLFASYYFYMSWRWEYGLLMLLSTLVDYFAALTIQKMDQPQARKTVLLVSLVTNLGILFTFKYYAFFMQSTSSVLNVLGIDFTAPILKVLLPVGISFYTFQSMAYTIDVYRKKLAAEKNFIDFALYVSYFPQLVAGPIERADQLLPQLKTHHPFLEDNIRRGFILILLGLAKKLVIADRIAPFVNEVYSHTQLYDGFTHLIATYAFAIQIYCDFSGYSDIAIGSALTIGVRLMKNFNLPYTATSVSDFWQRWHISLSSWFRDYVYIPLGGGRVNTSRWVFNVCAVFLLSGLWHGANWTFIIWGGYHAVLLLCERLMRQFRPYQANKSAIKTLLYRLVIFNLVCLGWIFFRAESCPSALDVIRTILTQWSLPQAMPFINTWLPEIIVSVAVFIGIEYFQTMDTDGRVSNWLCSTPRLLRWSVFYMVIIFILAFGQLGRGVEFIYFQF